MTDYPRLADEQLAVIRHRGKRPSQYTAATIRRDYAALLAEVDQLRAELAKYVGHEPTLREEMAELGRRLDAVDAICDAAEHQATRWEHPLPVPEWVAQVRAAANGETAASPTT